MASRTFVPLLTFLWGRLRAFGAVPSSAGEEVLKDFEPAVARSLEGGVGLVTQAIPGSDPEA